ncbi:hypothetical protein D3C76_902530 [compost metagenome]
MTIGQTDGRQIGGGHATIGVLIGIAIESRLVHERVAGSRCGVVGDFAIRRVRERR